MIVLNIVLGILELIVLIVSYIYFMSHVGRNVQRKKLSIVIGFLFYGLFLIFSKVVFNNEIINISAWIILSMIIGHMLYNTDLLHLFYYAGFTLSLILMQLGVIMGINTIYLGRGWFTGYGFANICLVIKILLTMFLTLIWTFVINHKKIRVEKKKQVMGMFILPVFSMVFLVSMLNMSELFTRLYGFGLIIINIVILLGLNIYFLYLYSYISKSNALEQELQLFQQQTKLQHKYYEDIEKKYQTSRTLIHDIRNHLHALERLYKTGEAERAREYVNDMHQILNSLGQKYYTSHQMLNIILNDKMDQAKGAGIETKVQIGDIDLSCIRDMDITVIFANILDNAIAAVRKSGDAPYIHIKADKFNEFIVISVKNSMNKDAASEVGHMGIGLNNVEKTLNYYNGNLQKREHEKEFELCIMIPRQEEEENETNHIFNNDFSGDRNVGV